jgi:ABC-type antimicrobial peptide transport system permease subunit
VIRDYASVAWQTLAANRLRSFLMILGLVAGVAAIVSIQVAAAGMASAVTGLLAGMNTTAVYLFPSERQPDLERALLHERDVALLRSLPDVAAAMPFFEESSYVRAGHHNVLLSVGGASEVRFDTSPLMYGRRLDPADVRGARSVCVLSAHARERLFPNDPDPVGRSVRIGDRRFIVVGVLGKARIGGIIPTTNILVSDVAIPYTTFRDDFARGQPIFAIQIFPVPGVTPERLGREATQALGAAHGGAHYEVFDLQSVIKTIDGFFFVVGALVTALGAISLVVAGIGIMSIMLVSILQRTREIGIRKAVGARRLQILVQFLVEAFVISLIGCSVGLVIGLAVGWATDTLLISRLSGVVAPVPWLQTSALAVGFAAMVAVVFGTYPAYRAARLDPIEALRYE